MVGMMAHKTSLSLPTAVFPSSLHQITQPEVSVMSKNYHCQHTCDQVGLTTGGKYRKVCCREKCTSLRVMLRSQSIWWLVQLSTGLDPSLCKIFFAVSFTYLGIRMISLSNWPQIIIQLKLLYCLQLYKHERHNSISSTQKREKENN
jgi:hypothetical protein